VNIGKVSMADKNVCGILERYVALLMKEALPVDLSPAKPGG
jgi:hypothetical protein